jgi:hypothetical protein
MAKKGQFKKDAKPDSIRQRKYNSQEEQKKNRVARNAARRDANRKGKTHKGDGKDVDHKRQLGQGGSRSKSNTRVTSVKANRSRGGRLGGSR